MDNRETKNIASSQEIKNVFALPKKVTDAFVESTEKALSIFDDHQQSLYREFMESIVDK